MKKAVSLLGCVLAFTFTAHADYTPIALTLDSYNHDAVVENTAPGPIQTLVTANMDAGTNIAGLVGGNGTNHASFYEYGFSAFSPSPVSGLPSRGSVFAAVSDTNHLFRMPLDYTTNNAVFIGGSQDTVTQVAAGTLTLTPPAAFKKLSILNAAGSGPATVTYMVHFQDGSHEQGTFISSDWLSVVAPDTNATAVIVNGLIYGTDGNYRSVNQTNRTPRLFYNDLTLANSNGLVTSVDFFYTVDNRRVAIFGVSGSTNGTNFTPLAVTGFNHDMIVEAQLYDTVTASMDFGFTNKVSGVWYEVGFARGSPHLASTGLPHPGTTFTALSNANCTFRMPPSYTTNNAIIIDGSSPSGAFIPETHATYNKLAVLASSTGGQLINYAIVHTDFTVETGSFVTQPWSTSSSATNLAFMAGGRATLAQNGYLDALNTNASKLYYHIISFTNNSPVARVNFSVPSPGSRSWIFALSGDSTGTGVFSPITVTGFNADLVVESSAGASMNSRFFTTITPGNGTNNNGLTFGEKGWNTLSPDGGLPLANSMVSSLAAPDRHYQMAPSYSLPNVIYLDTNYPVANITFATPTNYSALSFLATAFNQVQAEVIVHYADGVPSETNALFVRDWSSTAVTPAYVISSTVVTDTRAAESWLPGSTTRKLFDGQVALENLSNKVTGATLRWTTNNGSGGMSSTISRLFFFGVSGAIPVPEGSPVISQQPTNVAFYPGSNAVLTVSVTGVPPFTFQWQAAPMGSGLFTNVLNGGNISGASSSNLTITGINFDNNADYRLVVMNGIGTTTSSIIRVAAVSPLPNVLRPTDTIQILGGSSPTHESVTNAINGNLSKYLNYGLIDQNPPFVGPIGLTVTPTVGETTVSAIRIFAATDAPLRDPADFQLDGSNDGGSNWVLIASNSVAMPDARSSSGTINPLTQIHYEVRFTNTVTYTSYRVIFRNTKVNAAVNSLQIGELQLLGTSTTNPPVITQDIPAAQLVYTGDTLVLPVNVTGTPPFTYRWRKNGTNLNNGGKISGAQTNALSITSVDAADIGSYQLLVTNAYGSTTSRVDMVSVDAAPEFNGDGAGWTRNGTVNNVPSPATITTNVLSLTAGTGNTVRSAFLNSRQNITAFHATYTYHNPNAGGADGAAFILHNDPRGATAMGVAGGSLGASGITPGLSVQFNIYGPSGVGMAINTNGFVGNFRSTAPVNLVAGRPIDVAVSYYDGLLEITLNDATVGTSFSTNWAINLPSVVGGNAAYVGFSGATGGVTSTQNISNFQFITLPILTMDRDENGVLVSWPATADRCFLQSNTDLGTTNWVTVPGPLNLTNAAFQLDTGLDEDYKFYRLMISNP